MIQEFFLILVQSSEYTSKFSGGGGGLGLHILKTSFIDGLMQNFKYSKLKAKYQRIISL